MLFGLEPEFNDAERGAILAIATDAQELSDCLLSRVAKAFPGLAVSRSRVETAGGDHILLIVDDRYVFRFPRAGMHDLALEIEVLKLLQRQTSVPTPSYDYIDPAGRFAGYRFIEGVELTQPRFATLSAEAQERITSAIARFITELHSVSVDAVAWSGNWPAIWTAAEFAKRGWVERLPLIAARAPHLAAPIAEFYGRYRNDRPDRLNLVHGDLTDDHILFDQRSGQLTGIIDFGDVALGDPAQDFLGLWIYGAEVVSRAVDLYRSEPADPGLFSRSRNHFIRYRIDRFFETLADLSCVEVTREAEAIEKLLSPRIPS